MRALMVSALLMFSLQSFANQVCNGEAQIITTVRSSVDLGNGLCATQINEPRFNQENGICGLLVDGGSTILVASDDCSSLVDKEMSGVVAADDQGNIYCASSCSVYSK